MKLINTIIEKCYVINLPIFKDRRGDFIETFNKHKLNNLLGYKISFKQDNFSVSKYGVIRGLHSQSYLYSQNKLLTVIKGKILDVILDLRPQSFTYKKYISIYLSSNGNNQIFIPKGCFHGFSVLSKCAIISYKCDQYYNPDYQITIHPLDNTLSIDWHIPYSDIILSDKDKNGISFNNYIKLWSE